MKVRALRTIVVKGRTGEAFAFEAGEVKDLDPIDAAITIVHAGWDAGMKEFPLKLDEGVPPWPGCLVTWMRDDNVQGPGTVLSLLKHGEEDWLLVMDWIRQQGHLVRPSEVLDANPINVFSTFILAFMHERDECRAGIAREQLGLMLGMIGHDSTTMS